MPEKLDKNVILALLAQSDTKWFNNHLVEYDYRKHLGFTAEYIVKNYKKEAKKIST